MPYGCSQLVKKKSPSKFPEQFLRQDGIDFLKKSSKKKALSHDERIINVLKSDQAVVINPWPTMPMVKLATRIDANMFDPAELLRTDFHSILYVLYVLLSNRNRNYQSMFEKIQL